VTSRRRTTGTLAGASLLAGLLAYVLFAVVTRELGAEVSAPVSVLWTYWSLTAAAISFPLQHWIAQSVVHQDGFAAVRRTLPVVVGLTIAATGAAWLLSWAAREPLFGTDRDTFPALVAGLTAGAFLMGVLRGVLTATHRFSALAGSLVGEHVVRVVPVIVLASQDVRDPAAYGTVLALGSFVGLLWPPALRMPRAGGGRPSSSLRTLSSAAGAQLLAQLVLTSGPIVLALQGGAPAAVTALFLALAVFRAPFILAQGVVAPLTGRWTQLVVDRRAEALSRVRLGVLGTAVLGAASAAAVGAWLGPPVIRLVFGSGVEVLPAVAALVAAGSMLAVANVGTMILAIAMDRAPVALLGWTLGAFVALMVVSLAGGSPEIRTSAAFALAEAVAFATMFLGLRTPAGTVSAGRSTP